MWYYHLKTIDRYFVLFYLCDFLLILLEAPLLPWCLVRRLRWNDFSAFLSKILSLRLAEGNSKRLILFLVCLTFCLIFEIVFTKKPFAWIFGEFLEQIWNLPEQDFWEDFPDACISRKGQKEWYPPFYWNISPEFSPRTCHYRTQKGWKSNFFGQRFEVDRQFWTLDVITCPISLFSTLFSLAKCRENDIFTLAKSTKMKMRRKKRNHKTPGLSANVKSEK